MDRNSPSARGPPPNLRFLEANDQILPSAQTYQLVDQIQGREYLAVNLQYLDTNLGNTITNLGESGFWDSASERLTALQPRLKRISNFGKTVDGNQLEPIKEGIEGILDQINVEADKIKAIKTQERKQWYLEEGKDEMNTLIDQLETGFKQLETAGGINDYSINFIAKVRDYLLTKVGSEISKDDIRNLDDEPVPWLKIRDLMIEKGFTKNDTDQLREPIIEILQDEQDRNVFENLLVPENQDYEQRRADMEAPIPWDRSHDLKALQILGNVEDTIADEELTPEDKTQLLEQLKSKDAEKALINAAEHGKSNAVRFLLESGANPDAQDSKGWAAIHHAAKLGHAKMAEDLIKYKANLGLCDVENWTPVYTACRYAKIEVVKLLLKEKVDASVPTKTGFVTLHETVLSGMVEMVSLVHEYDKSLIDICTNDGLTPLIAAVSYSVPSTARYLLEQGANTELPEKTVNDTKERGKALYYACDHGNFRLVKMLLEYNAGLDDEDSFGHTPFLRAVYKGRAKVVEYLLQNHTIDVEKVDRNGSRAIHLAIYSRSVDTVEVLTRHKAKVDVRNFKGFSPLHIACSSGLIKIVRHLLDPLIGAVITAREQDGWSPLAEAASKGHLEVVDFLLSRGAKSTDTDDYEWTALHRAAAGNHPAVMESLLQAGCEIEAQSTADWTALHAAAYAGAKEAIILLLNHGADTSAKTSTLDTPEMLAARYNQNEAAALLRSYNPQKLRPKLGTVEINPLLELNRSRESPPLSSTVGKSNIQSSTSKQSIQVYDDDDVDDDYLSDAPEPPTMQRRMRVRYDYHPKVSDGKKLRVIEGDIVVVVREDEEMKKKGWCIARLHDKREIGRVPSAYLEHIAN